MERLEVRVSITKLLIILVIVIVPLSIVGLVLTDRSSRSLDNSIGNDFKALAQTYSDQVSEFIHDRVADVNAMAADSSVLAAVAGGSTASAHASPASQFLQQRRNLDPRYLRIYVTDADGNVVATSQPQATKSYATDEGWQAAYNKGQGAVKISDLLSDELTKASYVNIIVPVGDPKSGALAGLLGAAVNVTPVLARFQQAQIGNGARASLVNDDGTIVSAPNTEVFSRTKSPEYDYVRDAMGSMQGATSGWQMADLRGNKYIVGYSGTGLKRDFPNMGWSVLVAEQESVAAASVLQLAHFATGMVVLAVFMLTLLCVYWYLHRRQKIEDLEEVLPASTSDTQSQTRASTASV